MFQMFQMFQKAEEPTANLFWERKFNYNITESTWLAAREASKEIRLIELQYKLLHNIYPTNIMLQKMKVTHTNKCSYCTDTVDYIEHFFYECQYVTPLWVHVTNIIRNVTNINLRSVSLFDALFGLQQQCSKTDKKNANLLILIAKMTISIAKKTNTSTPLILLFDQQKSLREKYLHK